MRVQLPILLLPFTSGAEEWQVPPLWEPGAGAPAVPWVWPSHDGPRTSPPQNRSFTGEPVSGAEWLTALAEQAGTAGKHGGSAHAGCIARQTVQARARTWLDKKVPYSQCGGESQPCPSGCPYCSGSERWRCDCSGYVSYAWNSCCHSTYDLPAKTIKKDELQIGDAMLEDSKGHVVLFMGWANKGHTKYIVWQEPGCHTSGPHYAYAATCDYPMCWGSFHPVRYNNICNGPPSPTPPAPPPPTPSGGGYCQHDSPSNACNRCPQGTEAECGHSSTGGKAYCQVSADPACTAPPPPPAGGCKEFRYGFCNGGDDCMCHVPGEKCGAARNTSLATRSGVTHCSDIGGKCFEVTHGKCPGDNNCLYTTKKKCAD